MAKVNSLFVVLFLLLSAVSTSWCAADCAAKTLALATCHHEDTPKSCDDPTTVVPDAGLPIASFVIEPLFTVVAPPVPSTIVAPIGLFRPSPPLRL